jgi:hypothetical protein
MLDSDDVLLLEPAGTGPFPGPGAGAQPPGLTTAWQRGGRRATKLL